MGRPAFRALLARTVEIAGSTDKRGYGSRNLFRQNQNIASGSAA